MKLEDVGNFQLEQSLIVYLIYHTREKGFISPKMFLSFIEFCHMNEFGKVILNSSCDCQGNTPLHWACIYKNRSAIWTLSLYQVDHEIKNTNTKISSFVTIQEGCNKFCNFCVVPYTRGPEYSRSPSEIIREVKDLISNGVVEITL